tara:strand:- start:171 stop:611 length:441 start_codon:yes stop_codon:yes gene_type:complete
MKMYSVFKKDQYLWWAMVCMWLQLPASSSPPLSEVSPQGASKRGRKITFPTILPGPSLLGRDPADVEGYLAVLRNTHVASPILGLVESMCMKSFGKESSANMSPQRVFFYLHILQVYIKCTSVNYIFSIISSLDIHIDDILLPFSL